MGEEKDAAWDADIDHMQNVYVARFPEHYRSLRFRIVDAIAISHPPTFFTSRSNGGGIWVRRLRYFACFPAAVGVHRAVNANTPLLGGQFHLVDIAPILWVPSGQRMTVADFREQILGGLVKGWGRDHSARCPRDR